MDTSVLEYTAEDLVAHKLQRTGVLVAKPRFDREGADLLAMIQVGDGARFCRVQCKGRTLRPQSRSEVCVPAKYVTQCFTLFLFVETGVPEETNLYCFFGDDIRSHWKERDDSLVLALRAQSFARELLPYAATVDRIAKVKELLPSANVAEEISKVLVLGVAEERDEAGSISPGIGHTLGMAVEHDEAGSIRTHRGTEAAN